MSTSTTPPPDPRTFITPDSFVVAPELLGLPLAKPARRAGAMLVDLLAVALLANAGGVFLAFAAAIALWRASSPTQKAGTVRRGVRGALRFSAALALFIAVVNVAGAFGNDDDDDDDDDDSAAVDIDGSVAMQNLGLADLASIPDFIAVASSDDSAAVRQAAENLARSGIDADVREELLSELRGSSEQAWRAEILAAAFGMQVTDTTPALAGDSAVLAYADALARQDSAAIESFRPLAREAIAGERIQDLESAQSRLRRANAELQEEIEQEDERGSGIIGFFRSIADDLGIGFGWGALYFSAFLALWRGQTPGKRMFGVRVIRLDGRPLTWWIAFERFGGYAASLSTGLLGFLQILWDRNRQGLHDKAVETVVIRDLPASIAAEGRWRPAAR